MGKVSGFGFQGSRVRFRGSGGLNTEHRNLEIGAELVTKREEKALARRSAERRKRIVGHIAKDFADAERWDLEFWQSQTPEMRLSALVELREDLNLVAGRNKMFDDE